MKFRKKSKYYAYFFTRIKAIQIVSLSYNYFGLNISKLVTRWLAFLFILGCSSIGFTHETLQGSLFWQQFNQKIRSYFQNDFIGFFDHLDPNCIFLSPPFQEIKENGFASLEFLQDQLMEAYLEDRSREFSKRRKVVYIKNYFEPFCLYVLYDWVICLINPSKLNEDSSIFWDNITKHALKGVIVIAPLQPNKVRKKLFERGYEEDLKMSKVFSKIQHAQGKRLIVFRNKKPKIFFLSYVKSGSTWALYSLSKISGLFRGFFSQTKQSFSPKPRIGSDYDPSNVIMKIHDPNFVSTPNEN